MRKLILLLLLIATIYAGWYYLKDFSGKPAVAPLVRADLSSINRVVISAEGGKPEHFRLQRGEGEQWMATRKQRLQVDYAGKVNQFLELLTDVRSDSVLNALPRREGWPGLQVFVKAEESSETFTLYFPLNDLEPVYAHLDGSSTFLALPRDVREWRQQYLQYDAYRERRMLDLSPTAVDSISVVRGDSLWWGINTGDLSASAQRFIAPAAAPYADYFDEIAHRDREYASISLYAGEEVKRVKVYRDSLWPHPFVLVGEDYPRRFLGYDALR